MAANMQTPTVPPATEAPPAESIRRLKQSFAVMRGFVTNRTNEPDSFIIACEAFDTEFASVERLGFTPSDIFASLAYWETEIAS